MKIYQRERIFKFLPFLWNFIRNNEVNIFSKFLVIFGGFYLISFIDLSPDLIPFIGWIDDFVIVPLLVGTGIKIVSKNLIEKIWHETLGKPTYHPIED
jgi:uncharacterized membrane protein YkvA (DUF1232 family)